MVVEEFLQGDLGTSPRLGGKEWDEVWNLGNDVLATCKAINTHANQRYLQKAWDFGCSSWCFEQVFEDRECFLFYLAWLIISVWENEPKFKETTVNYFALRHYWLIEEYSRVNSESVKQYAWIVWASLISFLEVAR